MHPTDAPFDQLRKLVPKWCALLWRGAKAIWRALPTFSKLIITLAGTLAALEKLADWWRWLCAR
jgi:hypothetical protein